MFPGYIAYALFGTLMRVAWCCMFTELVSTQKNVSCLVDAGKCMSWMQIIVSGVIALGCFSTPLVTALAYGMALNNYIVLAVSGTVIRLSFLCMYVLMLGV